jgi:hypothetical protein
MIQEAVMTVYNVPAGTTANPPAEVAATTNLSVDANAIGGMIIGLVTPGCKVYV